MSEKMYNSLSVVQKTCVDAFIEGEEANEESKKFRRWVKRVWWGTSSIRNKDEVKRLCRGQIEGKAATAWDQENKRWGTHLIENVPILIASGLWRPDGIDGALADVIAMRISSMLKIQNDKKEAKTVAKEPKRDNTMMSFPTRTTTDGVISEVETFKRLKQNEQKNVKENQEVAAKRAWFKEFGPDALALKAIAEKSAKMKPIKRPIVLMCPLCNYKPLEQFLECSCTDKTCRDWKRCFKCDVVYHPTKIPCDC